VTSTTLQRSKAPGFRRRSKKYFHAVSDARYVIRKVLRIVDERAKLHGLEPLEHQALLQVFGARKELRVGEIAERLDVSGTFTSKLIKSLLKEGLVVSNKLSDDQRMIYLSVTDKGRKLMLTIDAEVERYVAIFTDGLRAPEKSAVVVILASYVGKTVDVRMSDERHGRVSARDAAALKPSN
jgi:DNA-binding MarR family transcriptional regulator